MSASISAFLDRLPPVIDAVATVVGIVAATLFLAMAVSRIIRVNSRDSRAKKS